MRKFAPVLLSISFMMQSLSTFAADNAFMRYFNSSTQKNPKNYFSESTESPFGQQCRVSDPTISGALGPLDELSQYFHPPECAYKVSELADPYSKQYCEKVNRCGNIKLKNRGDLSSLESLAQVELNEKLEKVLIKMELVERVKRFAELSGMKDAASKCKGRFVNTLNSNMCNTRFNNVLIDMVDAVADKNKDTPDLAGAKHDYFDFKEANKSSKTNFSQYFQKRVEYGMDAIIKNEDYTNLEAISIILADSSKTIDERKALFNTYLYKKNQENRLDPILSGMNKDSSFDLIHKEFLDKTLGQSGASKEDIKKSLTQYRENLASKMLGDDMVCNREESFQSLCSKGNSIVRGERVPKNIEEARANIIRENKFKNTFLLSTIHKKYFPGVPEDDDYESARMVLEVTRCSIYKFTKDAEKENTDVYYSLKVAPRAIIAKVDKNGNPVDDFDLAPKAKPVSESLAGSSSSTDKSEDEDIEAPKAKVVDDFRPSAQILPQSTIKPASTVSTNDSDEAAKIASQKATEAVIASGSQKEIDQRLSELTKRLEEANAKISKMNDEKVAAAEGAAKTQKIAEETKVIEDLKSQIAELKKKKESTNTQSTAAVTTPFKKPESNNSFNNSFVTSNSSKKSLGENKNTLPIERSLAQSSVGPSRSPSSINSNKQIVLDSYGRKSIEVIIDSNQLEKGVSLNEAILKKITGLNGEPFYIEEGGMLKQIIPILDKNGKVVLDKEGNPTFEKVTKGKTSEKLATKTVREEATPLPAITTQADLQRSQDELLGRSVYQEIQKITNEVLGNEN